MRSERELLQGADVRERIYGMVDDAIDEILAVHCPDDKHRDEWDMKGLRDSVYVFFDFTIQDLPDTVDELREMLSTEHEKHYEHKEAEIGSDMMQ